MTNARFDAHRRLPRHRVAEPLRRGGRARRRPGRGAAGAAHDGPRQRAHADAVGRRASTPASPPASRGSRSTRTTRRSTREAARADPDSVFHHYRRLIELRHDRAGGRARRLHDAAAGRRARLRVHAPARAATSCSCSATSPARTRRSSCRRAGRRARARQLRRCGRGARRAAAMGGARAAAGGVTPIEIETPHGPAPRAPSCGRGTGRAAALVLGHGAGGGDRGARPPGGHRRPRASAGSAVALVEQPYAWRAAARRRPRTSSTPPGSRSSSTSARGELARAARWSPAAARRARAWPAAPPRRRARPACSASRSRSTRRGSRRRAGSTSSTPSRSPCSSSRARADPFGMPPAAPGREVVVVPGTHSFTRAADRRGRGRAGVAAGLGGVTPAHVNGGWVGVGFGRRQRQPSPPTVATATPRQDGCPPGRSEPTPSTPAVSSRR